MGGLRVHLNRNSNWVTRRGRFEVWRCSVENDWMLEAGRCNGFQSSQNTVLVEADSRPAIQARTL